jgi:POT family proton-dependent oligopeptide transporter
MKVMMYSSQHRFRLDAAMPAFQAETHGRQVAWDDQFVFEMRRGIKACQVM